MSREVKPAHLDAFEGSSVHYWASPFEAKLCAGQEVALVGGGNLAGQAVVYLAERVNKVWVLLRGRELGAQMSRWLLMRRSAALKEPKAGSRRYLGASVAWPRKFGGRSAICPY